MKFVVKKIARRIDYITINNKHLSNIHKKKKYNVENNCNWCNLETMMTDVDNISLELFVEVEITVAYYLNYYLAFVIELSQIDVSDHLYTFIRICTIHLLSEVCQSVLCFSEWYFTGTKQIYFQLFNIKDDSSVSQWRTRHCIDMSLRGISFILCFCHVVYFVFALGYKSYGFDDLNSYYKTVGYYVISFVVDIMYFCCISLFYYRFRSINVWLPLWNMMQASYGKVFCLFLVASLILVAL